MEIMEKIKNGVLIYGTTSCGEALLQMCIEKGIQVVGYCDDNSMKFGNEFKGHTVVSFTEYAERYPEVPVLVGIISVGLVLRKLKKMGRKEVFLCHEVLKEVNVDDYEYTRGSAYGPMEVRNAINTHERLMRKDYFFVNNLDFVITERCSLRCRECSNLMQYYKAPVNFEVDELLEDLHLFLRYVSEINELRIIGGEPFMHPALARIINAVTAEKKIKKVSILSNGTIMPNEEQWKALENNKVILVYTDYGIKVSSRMEDILNVIEAKNINCNYKKSGNWQKCSRIAYYGRNEVQLRNVFEECCAKSLYTLLKGRVYCCPFLANAENLGVVSVGEDEVFDIRKYLDDIPKGQEVIRELFYEKDFFYGCNFCPGRPFSGEQCPPAEQAKAVIPLPIL